MNMGEIILRKRKKIWLQTFWIYLTSLKCEIKSSRIKNFFFELLTIHCMYNLDATLLSVSWIFIFFYIFLTFMQRMPNTVVFLNEILPIKKVPCLGREYLFKRTKMTFVQQKYKSTFNNRSLRRWLLLLLLLLTTNAHMIFWRKKITILYVDIIRSDTKKGRLSNRLQKKADGEKVLKG